MWICAGVVGLDSEELDLDLETDGCEKPLLELKTLTSEVADASQ